MLLFGYSNSAAARLKFEPVGRSSHTIPKFPWKVLRGSHFSGSENRVGWTVGTGIEWAIWNNWSIKAEYDYLDFGNKTVAINGTILPAPTFRRRSASKTRST